MELMVVNGRTKSDSPANFTFVDKKSMSVIDLRLFSYQEHEIIEDPKTMNLVSGFDHDVIEVKLKFMESTIKIDEKKEEL